LSDPRVVVITYDLGGTVGEYIKANEPYAEPIAQTQGLRWKIWILDEANKRAGGIYLFESDAHLQKFMQGEIIAEVKADASASFQEFDVIPELSAVTRAPLNLAAD
jgi:hypothetical protein